MDYLMKMLESQERSVTLPLPGIRLFPGRTDAEGSGAAAELAAALSAMRAETDIPTGAFGTRDFSEREMPRTAAKGDAEERFLPQGDLKFGREAAEVQAAEPLWSPEDISRYFERDARRYGGR